MNLQAKLTLGYVLLATAMVAIISAVNLGTEMQQQFDATLERAEILKTVAADQVKSALNRQLKVPLREALRDPALISLFKNIVLASHAILEVAVVDPHGEDEILLDSLPDRQGVHAPPYRDFRPLVTKSGWIEKLRVLWRDTDYYQLNQPLGSGRETLLDVRVVIYPALIRTDIFPDLQKSARVALISIIGAAILTFIFSAVMFRPLRHVGQMLDLVAKGEYEPENPEGAGKKTDELSVMASKVSLLSERLRGAQYEVSDLRGNIDHLLQDLEDAVFIFNRERRLVFASGSVEKFLGKQRADLPGQTIADVFPPGTTMGLLVAQSAQTGRTVRNRRVPLISNSDAPNVGVVLLAVDMLETVPGGTGSGLLVRLRDPEAQRKIGHELQTADRMAALSRVSSGVAHEVKNPLNAILLHVEVARAKLANGDTDVGPQMEIISREILRLDRVVKTFLDFTRPVELNLALVPLQELMNEIVDLAKPQASAADIRVHVQQEADGVEVRVDRDLLKQAVLNVVMNAMQAMPEGGDLRFESLVQDDMAEIRISDTGGGIPPELREKIFHLYFTTKKDGSGIGLPMTFRIVQLHDGTIDFTSEPGKGTTFAIRLPIA